MQGLVGWLVIIGVAKGAEPAAALGDGAKQLLEQRLDAAKKVFRQNLLRFKNAEALVTDLFGWSERWLDAEIALSKSKDDRVKACRNHLERTRDIERTAVSYAKSGMGRQADADAATYFRLEAEIRLSKEQLPPQR